MALYKSIYYYYFLAHQHKAAGRKARLYIQNYGCNTNLLCDHGVVERSRISSLQSHGKVNLFIIIIDTGHLHSEKRKSTSVCLSVSLFSNVSIVMTFSCAPTQPAYVSAFLSEDQYSSYKSKEHDN